MDLKNESLSKFLKKPASPVQNHIPVKKQNWLLALLTKQNIELLLQTIPKRKLRKYIILSFILIEIVLTGIIMNIKWLGQFIIYITN